MKFNNLLFAHRGVHNNIDIPENSMQAFKLAIKNNLNIEFDLQLTKDNILVVFHDNNMERMTGINSNINQFNYEQLKKIKLLNTKETIPTFRDVLKLINGKVILDIEVKDTKKINLICKKIVSELSNYNYPFIIKSFNPRIIRWFKKNNPEYIRGLLIKDNRYNKFTYKFIINYCKPCFLAISKKIINKKGIKTYLKKYPILIWTLKSKDELLKYNNISNNYICNNVPFE